MIIAIGKLVIRDNHLEKVLPILKDNSLKATQQKGYIEGYLSRGIENPNEILVYSLWQCQEDYEVAKKSLKSDPHNKKIIFKLLPHISKQPEILTFETLPPY